MKEFISEAMEKGMCTLHRDIHWKAVKLIYLGGFLIGFIMFCILGKEFADNNALLDIDALREVRDAVIDKQEFYVYVLYKRVFWLVLGILFWWWRLGKYYTCILLAGSGFSMGACMCTALQRYYVKGLFLWIFLYIPQVFCYMGVFVCAVWLTRLPLRTKEEKIQFLCRNVLFLLALLLLFGLGVYLESHVNTMLLQDFLTFF